MGMGPHKTSSAHRRGRDAAGQAWLDCYSPATVCALPAISAGDLPIGAWSGPEEDKGYWNNQAPERGVRRCDPPVLEGPCRQGHKHKRALSPHAGEKITAPT